MSPQIVVKQSSTSLAVLRWTIIVMFRFFTGRPMDGKKKDNSSFLKGATRGSPGKALTKWQKKPHIHRALIRGSVFWALAGICAMVVWNTRLAIWVLVFCLIPLSFLAFRKVRLIFFVPFTSTDAVTGKKAQHWILRPKYKRLIHRQKVPGVLERKDRVAVDFPPDVERALREVIDAQQSPELAPTTRVRPVRK